MSYFFFLFFFYLFSLSFSHSFSFFYTFSRNGNIRGSHEKKPYFPLHNLSTIKITSVRHRPTFFHYPRIKTFLPLYVVCSITLRRILQHDTHISTSTGLHVGSCTYIQSLSLSLSNISIRSFVDHI